MSRADTKGFAALLEGRGIDVHVGAVRGDADAITDPYVLILPTYSPDLQTRYTGSRAPRLVSHVVHSYAVTWDEAGWLDDRVDAILRPGGWGLVPVVEGRSCERLERVAAFGAEPDDERGSVWHAYGQYDFMSNPI